MALLHIFHHETSQQERDEQAVHDKLSDDRFELV